MFLFFAWFWTFFFWIPSSSFIITLPFVNPPWCVLISYTLFQFINYMLFGEECMLISLNLWLMTVPQKHHRNKLKYNYIYIFFKSMIVSKNSPFMTTLYFFFYRHKIYGQLFLIKGNWELEIIFYMCGKESAHWCSLKIFQTHLNTASALNLDFALRSETSGWALKCNLLMQTFLLDVLRNKYLWRIQWAGPYAKSSVQRWCVHGCSLLCWNAQLFYYCFFTFYPVYMEDHTPQFRHNFGRQWHQKISL